MATPRAVVGFDIGTNFGWSVLVDGERDGSGTLWLPSGRKNRSARWCTARRSIEEIIRGAMFAASGPGRCLVAYESVKWLNGKPDFARIYYGLAAFIEESAFRLDVECAALLPHQWKKIAVGKGGASKPAYIAAANERYGLDLDAKNEDEAAALGVAYAALVDMGGPVRLVTGQQETL